MAPAGGCGDRRRCPIQSLVARAMGRRHYLFHVWSKRNRLGKVGPAGALFARLAIFPRWVLGQVMGFGGRRRLVR